MKIYGIGNPGETKSFNLKSIPWTPVLIGGGILIALVGGKKLLDNVASFFGRDDNASKNTPAQAGQDATTLQASGVTATYPDSNYASFADTVYEGLRYSWISDSYSDGEAVLKEMKNDLDVAKLISAYGTRQEYYFGLDAGAPKSLFQAVVSNYEQSRIDSIQSDWAAKAITYKLS
jgi:hypothetical protein